LATYGLFEMQFQDKIIMPDSITIDEVATIDVAPNYQVEVVQKKDPEPIVERSRELRDVYKEVKNDEPIVEAKIFTPDAPKPTTEPVKIGDIKTVEKPEDIPIVDFKVVEVVPIFPGCERKKTNEERRKCMSKKITKLVNNKFNTDIANEYGISGLQKISTQFTVDKNGNITDIKIRGPHPALEKEAKRVINEIPSMKPGLQQDKPVGVIYNLPIKFLAKN
jgi:protein TonB